MANSKNLFEGLVKITGNNWARYDASKNTPGILMFAHIEGDSVPEHNGKYIVANGIEYKIADAADFDALNASVADISSWKRAVEQWIVDASAWKPVIDASVSDLSTRMGVAETSIGEVSGRLDNASSHISEVSTRLADLSTYVHETVDASVNALEAWRVDNDASVADLSTKMVAANASISDISSRLADALESATLSSLAADDNSTLLVVSTQDASGDVINSSVKVSGDTYVKVGGSANAVEISLATVSVANATEDASGIATAKNVKDYVDAKISNLEQALVFKGNITSATVDASLTTEAREAGDTFVASGDAFDYNGEHIEAGDMVIVKADSAAGSQSQIMVIERNLDGAVTAGEALTSGNLVIGASGAQDVSTSNIAVADLATAMANANSAVQTVSAAGDEHYIDATVSVNGSTATVSVNASIQEVSTATASGQGLADAYDVKQYVDDMVDGVKVNSVTLNSSTADYVKTSATVSDDGKTISASVGVVVVTLENASNGSIGLADAKDVYDELTAVEEVIARANASIAQSVGLSNDNYAPGWSTASGIASSSTYREVIEDLHAQVGGNVVNSLGSVSGDIALGAGAGTDNVSLWMDGQTLKGYVDLSDINTSIGEVSTRINNVSTYAANVSTHVDEVSTYAANVSTHVDEVSTRLADLSTYVHDMKVGVASVTGESAIAERANDDYVAVAASTDADGNVTLDASVKLAADVSLSALQAHNASTGLATDGYVKDYVTEALAWEVIGND